MGFTNTWDDTTPADSQLANLLGLDIRNLKTDIEQRMAQGFCGLFANQPVLEAVFGAAGNGVPFFATDQKKLYQWNGANYVEVACWQTFEDLTSVAVVNPVAETTLNTITIPANFMSAGYTLEVFAAMNAAGANAVDLYRLYVGGTIIHNYAIPNAGYDTKVSFSSRGVLTAATTMSIGSIGINLSGGPSADTIFLTGLDLTMPLIIKTTCNTNANRTYTPSGLFVKLQR